ncbi:antitoxin [Ornithinimicrobium sp. Y1847]|uniref:antitoxin n=1 Tax=unclassified Ornithinimicrobium TaxID=2615080 RepID=UPI003B67294C
MRTTVTLDPDTEQIIRQRMSDRQVSFKRALNDAIREGALAAAGHQVFRTTTANLGRQLLDTDRALTLAAELEDEETLRRMGRH